MNRRKFLISLSGLMAGSLAPVNASFNFNNFDFWVWVHPHCNYSDDDWQKHFSRLKEAGVSKVLIQVYTGGAVFFKSDLYAKQHCDLLQQVLPIAKELDLQVHAWMWTMINPSAILVEKHPGWYVVNRLGKSSAQYPPYVGYYKWLCPSREDVKAYLLKVVDQLLQYETLTGIHFDYIRYPDVILPEGIQPKYNLQQVREEPEFDYCYCSACRQAFKAQTGIDPLELKNPEQNRQWALFREQQITGIVKMLATRAKSAGKVTSAAVFATPQLARKYVRQNWPEWPLDYIFPMIYHQFYNQPLEWIFKATLEGTSAVGKQSKLISGLFLSSIDPQEIDKAITLVKKGGAAGVSFFSHTNLIQNQEYLNILQNL